MRLIALLAATTALASCATTMSADGPSAAEVAAHRDALFEITTIQTELHMLAATEQQLRARAPDGIAMQAFPPEFLGIPKGHPGYRWVARHMTPHPLKTWLDPIALPNGGSAGLNDMMLSGLYLKRMLEERSVEGKFFFLATRT